MKTSTAILKFNIHCANVSKDEARAFLENLLHGLPGYKVLDVKKTSSGNSESHFESHLEFDFEAWRKANGR